MNSYAWNAEDYEKHSLAQQKWARELISKLQLKGTEDVLDLGCGEGKVTAEIARLVANGSVVGVDSSSSMIKLASERYPITQYPNLSFRVMDAGKLIFEERFDVVFSNAALHWVKNHRPVVDGAFRSLKPGGRLLFQMGGRGNAREILSVVEEIQSHPDWQRYFENFDFPYGFLGVEEYVTLLSDAGFVINRVELIPKDMEHEGKAGLEGWIRTTWLPYTSRIPELQRNDFIETISSKYLEKVPISPDGKSHVSMVRIEVEAEKVA